MVQLISLKLDLFAKALKTDCRIIKNSMMAALTQRL